VRQKIKRPKLFLPKSGFLKGFLTKKKIFPLIFGLIFRRFGV
jgi:hypothetical protein